MNDVNKRLIPLKYVLGIAYHLENTNKWELVLYDLLQDPDILSGKAVNMDHVAHTIMFQIDRKTLKNCMDELIAFGYATNESKNNRSPLYKIINHPWHE